jgi:hypothetical protein
MVCRVSKRIGGSWSISQSSATASR